jgi:glycosyl transferase family 25
VEFHVTVVEAIQHEMGLIGLWYTMKNIIRNLIDLDEELILICQDDHQFTEHYSFDIIKDCIEKGKKLDADILLGGVSWFQSAIRSSKYLYWIEKFSGLQFAIIFKGFFFAALGLRTGRF